MLARLIFPEVIVDWSMITSGGVLLLFSLMIMLFSETFDRETKSTYEKKLGVGTWLNVVLTSVFTGFLSGILSGIGGYIWGNGYYFFYLINFGTVIGYIGAQSYLTDALIYKVDRTVLRIAYLDTMILTILFMLNSYGNTSSILMNSIPVVLVYIALFLVFVFSSIGPSDVRGIIVVTPFLVAIDPIVGIGAFLLITGITMYFMTREKKAAKDPMLLVPILPYLTLPYIILIPFIPLFITLWRVQTLI